jgi:hypothetical protein
MRHEIRKFCLQKIPKRVPVACGLWLGFKNKIPSVGTGGLKHTFCILLATGVRELTNAPYELCA